MRTRCTKMIQAAALALPMALSTALVRAEAPNISGHIESTYMYDFNDPQSGTTAKRSYDATHNSFYINAVHLAITGELQEGVGYTVEIDHGSDSGTTGSNTDVDIQEAYLTFPIGPVAFTAGKFVTYEGIEVIEGPDNPTISRGYLYGLAEAFTHVGAKAHIGIGEKVDVGVGVVNGRDVDTDNNESKTIIFRIGFDLMEEFSFGISGSHGSDVARSTFSSTTGDEDQTSSLDITGSFGFIPKLPIAFQYLYAQQDNAQMFSSEIQSGQSTAGTKVASWYGFGIQPVLEINDQWSIGGRYEWMNDEDRTGHEMSNVTVTPTYKVNDAVTVRAELRVDSVSESFGAAKPFQDDKGMPEDGTTTASLGFSYSF